ncbi:MAG: ATP-binding protein [Prolixibacteraceae bacterium]
MKINRLTLSFTDENEKKYQAAYFANSILQFRIAFVLVIFLYGIFGYLDDLLIEQYAYLFHIIRFGIVVPLMILVFLLSFTKYFSRIWQELSTICYVSGGIGISIMLIKAPENYTYYGGLMLVFMAGYFFIGLRFLCAAVGGWFILVFFNIGAIFFSDMNSKILVSNDFFFVSANLIGMFAGYIMEYYRRRGFYLNQQLDFRNAAVIEANKNLEHKVNIRTEELNKAKEKAEESDRLKSAFLANMSHEIRTPLNSIVGFSELLNDPDFEEEQKQEFIKTIVDSGNSLMVIINDIMDLSMMESKQLKIRPERFPLITVFEDLENEFRIRSESNKLDFIITLPADAENIFIEYDIYRLKQIFNNLIGNALKFTEKGSVEIGCSVKRSAIEFYVQDTGIGIPRAHHETIFERFRQVDITKARKYGGNGLGLAISKKLVENLGGEIRVKSEEGAGSTFYFTIPYVPEAK